MTELWTETGTPLTKAESNELRRLNGKHRDIATHGAVVLERVAEKHELQERRQAFVSRHGLSCFRCGGSGIVGWAKCGGGDRRRPWAICNTCIRKPKAAA